MIEWNESMRVKSIMPAKWAASDKRPEARMHPANSQTL
jgi:hypothetical protein